MPGYFPLNSVLEGPNFGPNMGNMIDFVQNQTTKNGIKRKISRQAVPKLIHFWCLDVRFGPKSRPSKTELRGKYTGKGSQIWIIFGADGRTHTDGRTVGCDGLEGT